MNGRSQERDKSGDEAPVSAPNIAAERHVVELRRAFDTSFAAPPRDAERSGELVLAIQAGGQGYALRLSDIDGVHECRKVVPLPEGPPGLLGITGIRGRLFAVHALGALLGLPTWNEKPRWLLIAGGDEPIAIGVASIEACLEVSPADLVPVDSAKEDEAHVREIVTLAGEARGVLVLESLVARALERAGERREGAS
ncbi:chemotaxis protein CheW [Polyangium jinanense]|uniref:Chemotaxis protein CheW n=1 Tax=Polyangium jinanense TaxID=2829994 RepID=A0A9X4AS07_9BACT|nr:chemotaxis protein CheW [Polyangium jinanense]MDC3952997.1 chemotaxis protein CheW [Polyangium jinanense]MDC3980615.1 chemotaxis protein CheW [Polyangium jinanense]